MKLQSLLLMLGFIFISFSISAAQTLKVQQIEKISFDWQKTGMPYDILIERTDNFDRLRIKVPGHKDFTIIDSTWLDNVKEVLLDSSLFRMNLGKSKYFYFSPVLRNKCGTPALIVFGCSYASDPGSIHVIMLDSLGIPSEVFFRGNYQLTGLEDIDNDGLADIIGKDCLSQLWDNDKGEVCFSTYDPYSVYKLNRKGKGRAAYNLELSKKYNIEHYYGWAGKDCSEETVVVLCTKDGKPKIMNIKKVERIYK